MSYLQRSSSWSLDASTGTVIYSSYVERDIDQICSRAVEFNQKVVLLRKIELHLEDRSFTYKHPRSDFARGQQSLLRLWRFLLEYADSASTRGGVRAMFLRLIVSLSRRDEFSLRHAGFGRSSRKTHAQSNTLTLVTDGIQQYREVLLETLTYVSRRLEPPKPAQETLVFGAQILAVAYFVFPWIQEYLLSSLRQTEQLWETDNGHMLATAARHSQDESISCRSSTSATVTPVEDELIKKTPPFERLVSLSSPNCACNETAPSTDSPKQKEGDTIEVVAAMIEKSTRNRISSLQQRFRDQLERLHIEDARPSSFQHLTRVVVRSDAEITLIEALRLTADGDISGNRAQRFIAMTPDLFYWPSIVPNSSSVPDFMLGKVHHLFHRFSYPARGVHGLFCLIVTQCLIEYVQSLSDNVFIPFSTLPGYPQIVRAFFSIFAHFCRYREGSDPTSLSRACSKSANEHETSVTSQKEHVNTTTNQPVLATTSSTPCCPGLSVSKKQKNDIWAGAWDLSEVTVILDCAEAVLSNPDLLNPMMQIILENTNCYDLVSIDACLDKLQRLFPAAAHENSRRQVLLKESSAKRLRKAPRRRRLGSEVQNYGDFSVSVTSDAQYSGDEIEDDEDCEEHLKGVLPASLDVDCLIGAVLALIASRHFQILLKTLTFIYTTVDLLEGSRRRQIVCGMLLHQHFFDLFLHWNADVRRLYYHILVFKMFNSSRLQLPCLSDEVLLRQTKLLRPVSSGVRTSGNSKSGYPDFFGFIKQHLIPTAPYPPAVSSSSVSKRQTSPPGSPLHPLRTVPVSPSTISGLTSSPSKSNQADLSLREENLGGSKPHTSAFDLIARWQTDSSATVANNKSGGKNASSNMRAQALRHSLFGLSLDDDETSLDLSVASKLDAMLKMLTEQITRKNRNRIVSRHVDVPKKANEQASIELSLLPQNVKDYGTENVLEAQKDTTETETLESESLSFYDSLLEVYVPRALDEYQEVLKSYYQQARIAPDFLPQSPQLEFKVVVADQID